MKMTVLGLGYTGRQLFQELEKRGHAVLGASAKTRIGNSVIHDFSTDPAISLAEKQDCIITTFPLHSLDFMKFTDSVLQQSEDCLLFSSTGVFLRGEIPVNEQSARDSSHKRHESEKYWLENGGKIIYLSGIYGPGRNPADWVRSGKVKKNPRQLNMVHISDIVNYTLAIMEMQSPPPAIILSDGQIHTWTDVCNFLEAINAIPAQDEIPPARENVFINSSFSRTLFPGLDYQDFWHGLKRLN